MTERISTFVQGEPLKSGIPVQKLINLYEKWSHGGFGMILSGNIPVDFVSLNLITTLTHNFSIIWKPEAMSLLIRDLKHRSDDRK
jgi:hypothetical protein